MNSYSQHGEDIGLWSLFQGKAGTCVEVGAFDGLTFSNTLLFEQMGWTCVLVEPNPDLCKRLRETRPKSILFECAASDAPGSLELRVPVGREDCASTSPVSIATQPEQEWKVFLTEAQPLDHLLSKAEVTGIDFISIDVEGMEESVLKGFDLAAWRPRIVILEDNSLRLRGAQPKNGASGYMKKRDYYPFRITGVNVWYARKDERRFFKRGAIIRMHAQRLSVRLGSRFLLLLRLITPAPIRKWFLTRFAW